MARSYVLIGGGLASARAAEAIRERDPGGRITLVAAERELPYNRPDLSKGYLLGKRPLEKVFFKPKGVADAAAFYRERDIDVALATPAIQLDRGAHTVTLDDGRMLNYDRLLLATGGRARRLDNLPGSNLPDLYYLRTLEDANALRLEATGGPRRAVVIGGSFIGAEVASALAQLGHETTLVMPQRLILERALGERAAQFVTERFRRAGVTILSGARPEAFLGADQRLTGVRLDGGAELPADLVALGVGLELNTELARQAGLALDERLGGVEVDEQLRTSDPDIYAAGDIAAYQSPLYGRRMRIEHWDHARQSGRQAGLNMAGDEAPYDALPYFYSDLFDLDLQAYGDLYQWDEVLARGPAEPGAAPAAGQPALMQFYLYRDVLRGVLAVNPPDYHSLDPLHEPLKRQPVLGRAERERLADTAIPLGDALARPA
jgi:3-phenylpropionate/trans-cinnamate dioxygenase ferredoxin reductase subunit